MSESLYPSQALPSLLAGVARQPLPPGLMPPGEANATLHALSLTGQALRFERPTTPSHFAVEAVLDDDRALISDRLRRPLLRVLSGKSVTDHPAAAIARTLHQLRLRPHPFDLPRLDAFVRRYADSLGVTAQHWARSKADAAEAVGFYDRDLLDETNWTQSTLARRASFFEGQRRQAATRARALLEAAWPNENADARARLLQSMQIHLSAADQPFLESLAKDRSPRVRQLAQRLLAKLGVTTENHALKGALERIARSQSGLLRRRALLTLQLPATVKEQAAPRWIAETFAEVTLEELAGALALSEAEMVEASAKDVNLSLALALIATVDNRLDLLESVVAHLPNAWELLSDTGLTDLGPMSRDDRMRWAKILIQPYGRNLPWNYTAWSWLHIALEGSAPTLLLETALKSGWFNEPPSAAKHTPYWMEVTVALCPPSQRQALRERLETFDPTLTASALPLLHLLHDLENSKPHA